MLIGKYFHTVDAKGRVSMPAKFRDSLGGQFVLSCGRGQCLQIYSMEEWMKFMEKLLALKGSDANKLRKAILSNSVDCEIDAQGRILLPAEYRSFAKILREVAFIGMCDHAEIWDKGAWDKQTEGVEFTPEGIEELMESLGL